MKPTFRLLGTLVLLVVGVILSGCGNPQDQARREAQIRAEQRRPYVQQSNTEFDNYDRRQRVSDDPTLILWCTSAFPVPSSPLFTVPIVGKLTSGHKRPYAIGGYGSYAESAGPDGMYGSSGEYRYGFTPGGVYADFYNLATFCTTEPTVWQREQTTIVLQTDSALNDAQKRAQQALQANKPDEANKILEEAIRSSQGRR